MGEDTLRDEILALIEDTLNPMEEAASAAPAGDEPAVVYAGLDDKDKAFYWLERAYQERSNWLTLIKVGRRLKNLRGDPRFDDLLKRVGF